MKRTLVTLALIGIAAIAAPLSCSASPYPPTHGSSNQTKLDQQEILSEREFPPSCSTISDQRPFSYLLNDATVAGAAGGTYSGVTVTNAGATFDDNGQVGFGVSAAVLVYNIGENNKAGFITLLHFPAISDERTSQEQEGPFYVKGWSMPSAAGIQQESSIDNYNSLFDLVPSSINEQPILLVSQSKSALRTVAILNVAPQRLRFFQRYLFKTRGAFSPVTALASV